MLSAFFTIMSKIVYNVDGDIIMIAVLRVLPVFSRKGLGNVFSFHDEAPS